MNLTEEIVVIAVAACCGDTIRDWSHGFDAALLRRLSIRAANAWYTVVLFRENRVIAGRVRDVVSATIGLP